MPILTIITSKAISLKNVGKDIAEVAQEVGVVPRLFKYPPNAYDLSKHTDYVVICMSASPLLARPYMLLARELRKNYDIPTLFYATIEGKPLRKFIRPWMLDHILYVANSNYTKDKLTEAGFPIYDMIYHGVNFKLVESAKSLSSTIRKKIKQDVGDKVVLGVVSNSHKRKGLEPFLNVCSELLSRRDDVRVFIITNAQFQAPKGVSIENLFGKLTHTEVLAFIGAFDYLVIPSLSEGFGLPLVEANALGVPVIHCNYPPLSEITGNHNLTFPYETVSVEDLGDGIDYELHIWNKNDFLSTLEDAIDCIKKRPSEYEDRRSKALEHARKFDIRILYRKLLNILGIKCEPVKNPLRGKEAEG